MQIFSFPRECGGPAGVPLVKGWDGGVYALVIAPIPTFPRRRVKESTLALRVS